jgi:hypothetical protein
MRSRLLLMLGFTLWPWLIGVTGGVTVSGRILDTQGGLPVPNAIVQLDRNGVEIATARPDANGSARLLRTDSQRRRREWATAKQRAVWFTVSSVLAHGKNQHLTRLERVKSQCILKSMRRATT